MWKKPDPDPGGQGPEPPREIKDLRDQNEQQQVLIAQLKEMLRKEQSTVPQEKVEEYVNTLSKVKAKKSRLKKDELGGVERSSGSSMDNKKHERVNLLKQQLEENKARLAERGMRQKDIEEMVTAIKTQLNDSQPIINVTQTSEKNLDYNKSTNPEELYNILLVKERKITDLLEKTQKQEGIILDLQENLKEKDQVIDARTKAITLMTDNLSKKGKDTLDALDETKEQMRKMQENFIILETEMKARQMVLLNDLKSKNLEIAELQEQNEKLIEEKNEIVRNSVTSEKSEVNNHEIIIKDLQQKLADSKTLIEEYTTKIKDLESKVEVIEESHSPSQNSTIEKLKKQLDESNKNMIKVKAQNKSKIKELNKKLDAFKKMSDANVMIVNLQNEITKLNEKIAELEDEKGNVQLKMVESIDTFKGSLYAEEVKELQDKLNRNAEEFEEKEKVIGLLESEIISLKSNITDLTEQNERLSQLQNDQVTFEMKSIQIEEQLEQSRKENNKLREEIEKLNKEKDELFEKIEEFKKEKLDLSTKLDNYIQENMELIDKLEKLSAEKVSSAESIEIVEGLTQQEKLEYQKNMEEPSKALDEEVAPSELNETVSQLTEDSTELLKRIEMFNVERKEVMLKLDALREENNQLCMKINEIENYRDILVETYEQVQSEKDDLQKENKHLVEKLKRLEDVDEDKEEISKLRNLQGDYEKLLEENKYLEKSLKDLDSNIHEKDNLETELMETKEKLSELEDKLKENIEEITNYRLIIEENKTELINSSSLINKLQTELGERENDVKELNVLINDLNTVVGDLQVANEKLGNFEFMENQVKSLNEQVQDFKEEIAFNKSENETLYDELKRKEEIIKNLEKQLQEKDTKIHEIIEEMKQKYLGLQQQLDNNNGSLETQIQELSNKNKEQLEKMKKIAANLKKKTQAYQELESRYKEEKEKWETEINTDKEMNELRIEIEAIKEEIEEKTLALDNSERKLKEMSDIIDTLQQQNSDLQNMLIETRQKQEKITEVSLKQELSRSLHEEFDNLHGSNESTNEDKINELQLIIETNESELNHYKERNEKLEQDLGRLLEEKEDLTNKFKDIEDKLIINENNLKEKILMEKEMSEKLKDITNNEEVLKTALEEIKEENGDLIKRNREQEELIHKLKVKVKKSQEKVGQLKIVQGNLEEQEQVNAELKKQLIHLETVQKQTQMENEELQKRNQRDYEKIENDYQIQLEELIGKNNELTFQREKLEETVKVLKEREEELSIENNELKGKINRLEENLYLASTNWEISMKKSKTLERKLMIKDKGTETVNDVINEAKKKIYDLNTKETQTEENNTKEDLETKIKALEILLFNVDKENEKVVDDCSDMFNEFTKSLYKKLENKPEDSLECQIMSNEEIDGLRDPDSLRRLEYEKCENEFLGYQNDPVQEEPIQQSKAYLTYQIGEENDDGWAWGPEEVRLEEEHQYRNENVLKTQLNKLQADNETHQKEIQQLQIKIGKLTKKCKELKMKNETLSKRTATNKNDFFDLEQTIQDELKMQVEELEKRIEECTGLLNKEKEEKAKLSNRLDILTVTNEKMMQQKEIQDCELLKWKRKYEESLNSFDWEENRIISKTDDVEESKENIEELKTLIKDLTADNEELQALLDDQKQLRVELEKSRNVGNETRMRNLEEELKIKIDLLVDLEKKFVKLKEEFDVNYEEKGKLLQQIDFLEEKLKIETSKIEEIKIIVNDLTKENEELRILLENQKQSEMELEGNGVRILEEELNKIIEEKRVLEEELKIKIDLLVDLEKKFVNLKEEFNVNCVEKEKMSNQIDVLTAANEKLTDLKETQEKLKLEASRYEEKENIEKLKIIVDNLTKENEELRVLIQKDSEEELNRLKNEELPNKINLIENLEEKLTRIQETNKELSMEKSNLVQQYQILYSEFEKLKESSSNVINNLQGEFETQRIKELSGNRAENLEQLIDIFKRNEEESKGKYMEIERRYQNLQDTSSRNILELQTELEESRKLQNETKESSEKIEELRTVIEELRKEKLASDEEIETLKNDLNAKQMEMDRIVTEMENKLVDTVTDLEEKWAAQVDERGNTVAESWKYHLSIVETDFAAIQEKLKNEINDLEEKCNSLVNENNELRKNVDVEIKNEVDRISALQQQINDRQRAINDLNQLLINEQTEKSALAKQVADFEAIQQLLADKEVELSSLKTLAETTRQQLDEKREVVEEIVKVLERNTSFPLSCEKQDILVEIQRQLGLSAENERQVETRIENMNIELQNYRESVREKEEELIRLRSQYSDGQEKDLQIAKLQTQVDQILVKDREILELRQNVEYLKEQLQQLNEKENEILRLQEIVEEYKHRQETDQQELLNMQKQYNEAQYAAEELKLKLEEYHQSNINLQTLVDEKNQQITLLNQQLQLSMDNKDTHKLETELSQYKQDYLILQQSLAECQQHLFDITQDLATKSHECETLNQQLSYSQQNAELLQIEINKINETLINKEQEYALSMENLKTTRYKELESHYEELISVKDLDVEALKTQVAESLYNANEQYRVRMELEQLMKQQQQEHTGLKEELETRLRQLEEKLAEQSTLAEEENKQLDEMRGIIEEQVVKIEQLKKELFEKSKDYDSLIAEMDISRNAITQQPVSTGIRIGSQSEKQPVSDDDLSATVNRAELDIALYMLHQRDVRCEELTVELTHLLEERDTLQLRLSNAIREKEEIRRKYSGTSPVEQSISSNMVPESTEPPLEASSTEIASKPQEKITKQDLASKLSELKQIGYKKDKTFVDEQELRSLQQMSIMQQHIKEVSKLPPEAAAKLVDASYTLSRDIQSPSKVLLNWLWGRSTPKVNDT
ncbi:protein lava lamp-like isoform X1 [Diorhabda carinulata]|uniref:protein lava lamp-like isoform X1 n=2 Tax=Diorhabda carinulata TaxID=1163345 RepID=UPI0025A2494B|nr:protein lava lamp-like isoform X1 [Diorhabda carinulata]